MTASALNIASIAPKAQPGGSAHAGGGNALAGFEALLGALFPGTDPTAMAATPAVAALTGAAVMPADEAQGEDKAADSDAAADAGATPTADPATAGDTTAAVMASLMAAQTAATDTPTKTPKDDAATPPAWGRDKAKGAPAAPALANANPKAQLAQKAGLTEDAAPEAADEAAPAADTSLASGSTQAPTAPATPVATNRTPVSTQSPQPGASAPAPGVAVEAPVEAAPEPKPQAVAVEPPAAETPAAADTAATNAALTARTETAPAPPPPPAPKAAKGDRTKAISETAEPTADTARAPEAANKAAPTATAQRAAKAGDAAVDAVDSKARETKTAPETPDAVPQGETHAAAQSAAPTTAHTTHAVRGSLETVANLAAQIVKKLEGKSTRFDVELDPQGLGKVDVRVEIAASGRVTAAMTFDNPQAAADVKARAAELQRALEQAGFDLSGGLSFDVADQRGQQQQNQAWQDQGETGRAFQGRAFRAALETAGDAAEAANQGALRLRRGVNAGLDVRI
ncbi:flagellar hook-length control protein FliK [Phenylobacterium sp.]|uniref:flagellar hook-length control protein FliK n=1 Tax=Phenylobacterium sp. TaxID=1871053 RepID=UPI0025F80776|nr:flagellar hook-length control protein FliK [Phenylobacterium sp.]